MPYCEGLGRSLDLCLEFRECHEARLKADTLGMRQSEASKSTTVVVAFSLLLVLISSYSSNQNASRPRLESPASEEAGTRQMDVSPSTSPTPLVSPTSSANPLPTVSPTTPPSPTISPSTSPTPIPVQSTGGTSPDGIPYNGLGLQILNGDYEASSVPSGTNLSAQIILSERDIAKPIDTEMVVLTFKPDNGTAPTVQNIALHNNFNGCGLPQPKCYYAQEPITVHTSGTMTLSYNGQTEQYLPITKRIDVWVPQLRSIIDQVDEKTGFQVHAIYVVPSNGVDRSRDSSGEISTWLGQGSRWLDLQAKDHWQVDTFLGVPDVTYFHSKYPTNILENADNKLAQLIMKEMGTKLLPIGSNRKTYLFFIEVPAFTTGSKDPDYKNGTICGLSQVGTIPVRMAIIATGSPSNSECSGRADIMDWQAAVSTHETIHTFGVHHVTTVHDLMRKVPDNVETLLFDPTHKQYFGGNLAGADLKTLRIWSSNPTNPTAKWPCIYDDTALTYWCGVGTTSKVSAYAAQCWKAIDKTMELQVLENNAWVNVGRAMPEKTQDCPKGFSAAYSADFSSKTPGTFLYRFKTSHWTGRTFTVIYQL